MARLKIKDAPLLPVINGDEKIPTGGKGDFTLTPNMLAEHFKSNSGFATDLELNVVDGKVNTHINNEGNPHKVTKEQVGLGQVNNTSDIDKPVSNATSVALDTKADKITTYTKTEVDSEFLSIYQNGAALPYDATMEYAEGAVVVKDGELQKKQGASWVSATNKGYNLDYFVSGKLYPLHAEIMLTNGDIVKSTVANNTVNPNVNMTGWVKINDASQIFDASGKSQQEVNDLSRKKLFTTYDLEVVSASETRLLSDIYPTLEAAKVDFPFVSDLSGSLGWAVLQKQFRELDSTVAAKKIISGTYYINKSLTYNAKSSVEWDLNLTLSGGVIGQYAITFDGIDVSKHSGKINLVCATTDNYDNHNWSIRTWWDGILFKRVTATDQASLLINGRLKGQLFNLIGVINNGNYAQFGVVTGTCGSRAGDWSVNITSVNNLGAASSFDQTSELTLSAALPPEVVGHSVKIGTDYHYIRSVSGNKIIVEIWVNPASTLLHVIYGGVARSNGDNANMISFKLLRGFRSAATYSCSTAMGVSVETFGSEYNEVGLIAGSGSAVSANISHLEIGQWYSEYNAVDIFDTRSGNPYFEFVKIKSEVGLGLSNWASNVFKASAKDNSFERDKLSAKPIVVLGDVFPRLSLGNNGLSENSKLIYVGEAREHIFKNDTQAISLDCSSKKIKNYGRNTAEIVQIGSGLNGGVARTTLQCFSPYSFRNPSETNGRFYYLGQTSKPRELKIVLNDDNIIDVHEANTDAPQFLADLSLKTGTGVFRFSVTSTANLGINPPTTSGVMRVQLYSSDIYTYEAVEELFCYDALGILTARKLRTKRGNNISAWIDLPIEQLNSMSALDPATATTNQIATAFNSLLSDLKAKRYMKL